MPLADQLRSVERDRDALLDRIEQLVTTAENEERSFTDTETATHGELKGQLDKLILRRTTLADALELQKLRAQTTVTVTPAEHGANGSEPQAQPGRVQVVSRLAPGIKFARYAQCIGASKGNLLQALEISKRWKDSSPEIERIMRAAIAVGTTSDPAWAGALVEYRTMADEFIGLLTPQTIIGQLPLRKVPFNVRIPRMTAGASAQWVGEGKAKPVSKGAFDTVTVPAHKLAVISVLTEELVRFSNPSAELVVRDMLIEAISQAMNQQFIDPAAAGVASVKPGSITNGVAAAGPVNGTAVGIRTAATNMVSIMVSAGYPLAALRWIMNPTLAIYMGGLRTAQDVAAFPEVEQGKFLGIPYVTSALVPINTVPAIDESPLILADCSSILLADDGQVTIDVSREASVKMGSDPEGADAAAELVSLWQTNCVGILAERFVTWVKARPNNVQVTNISHGAV